MDNLKKKLLERVKNKTSVIQSNKSVLEENDTLLQEVVESVLSLKNQLIDIQNVIINLQQNNFEYKKLIDEIDKNIDINAQNLIEYKEKFENEIQQLKKELSEKSINIQETLSKLQNDLFEKIDNNYKFINFLKEELQNQFLTELKTLTNTVDEYRNDLLHLITDNKDNFEKNIKKISTLFESLNLNVDEFKKQYFEQYNNVINELKNIEENIKQKENKIVSIFESEKENLLKQINVLNENLNLLEESKEDLSKKLNVIENYAKREVSRIRNLIRENKNEFNEFKDNQLKLNKKYNNIFEEIDIIKEKIKNTKDDLLQEIKRIENETKEKYKKILKENLKKNTELIEKLSLKKVSKKSLEKQEKTLQQILSEIITDIRYDGEFLYKIVNDEREILLNFDEEIRKKVEFYVAQLTRNLNKPIYVGGGSGGGTGGSGISSITVLDEGNLVSNKTTILNFIGTDVYAEQDDSNINQVNIYIPPPEYVSHFNTNDGTTDARVNDYPTTLRHIANPTSEGNPYKIGDWIAGNEYSTIKDSILTYQTNDYFSCKTNSTTFQVNIYDADETTVIATNQIVIDSDKNITQDGITINITNFSSDQNQYKCKVNVQINLSLIIPSGGRFSIEMIHNDDVDGIFTYKQNNIFYDINENLSTLTDINIQEDSANIQTIQISGVYYYTLNSNFLLDINDIDWLNDRSYPIIQVQVDGSLLGISQLNLQGSDLTNWNYQWDNQDASYHNTNYAINIQNYCLIGDAYVRARTIDWNYGTWQNSNTLKVCINTYIDNSTRIYEDFRLETQRLKSDFTAWDSTQNLGSYDDGLGLQVKCSRLIYPQEDFTIYNPNSSSQPDYSSLTGNRYYLRRMWHNNVSHSNGRFQFNDHNITEEDLNNHDVEIWISLNGTDWYCVNDDYTGGELNDGDGCRVNPDQYALNINNQIAFTFGLNKFTNSSTGGGWGMYVKIIFKDNSIGRSKYLGEISEVTWI